MITDITQKEKYIGYDIGYILQYIKKIHENKSNKRFLLITGKPGTGKTSLFRVLENENKDITIRKTNASDQRRINDIKVGDYISSGFNKNPIILLDECDGLQKNTWKKIEEMSKINPTIPIVLIANDITKIPDKIKKNSISKEIKVDIFKLRALTRRINEEENLGLSIDEINDIADKCQSYRCIMNFLEYNHYEEISEIKNQNQQILAAMRGSRTEFRTSDLRTVITIYHDNVKSVRDLELISQADIFLNKYEHGYGYGRNVVNYILNCVRNKKDKLEYPRTYKLIYGARNKDKNIKSGSKKSKKKLPNIAIVGLK